MGDTVYLDGSHSSDPNGYPLTYLWGFVSGPGRLAPYMFASNTPKPYFIPAYVGKYTIQFQVNDGYENSPTDFVQVTAVTSPPPPTPQNSPPIANAGANQTVTVGSLVPLNGSSSYDPDGQSLAYQWSFQNKPYGSTATITQPTAVQTNFTADVAGNYDISLVVADANASSTPKIMTVTANAVSPPPTSPPPAISTGTDPYGSAIRSDGLDEKNVGEAIGRAVVFRFRPDYSGQVDSTSVYINTGNAWAQSNGGTRNGSGYDNGTGGMLRCELQTDDGTASHLPSGKVLASWQKTISSFSSSSNVAFDRIYFGNSATVTAGQIYHLVFTNPDPNPTTNWNSLNTLYNVSPDSPMQPKSPDDILATLWKINTGSDWAVHRHDTPIFTLYYTDGRATGQGYFEAPSSSSLVNLGGSGMVREAFTLSGATRTVSAVSVCLYKSGTPAGNLVIRLETSDGTLIEQGTIPVASVPTTNHWVTYTFSTPRTLTSGSSYRLVLSSPSGAGYKIFPIHQGTGYGFAGGMFTDGQWQYSSNGGSSWGSPKGYNMQLYFTGN